MNSGMWTGDRFPDSPFTNGTAPFFYPPSTYFSWPAPVCSCHQRRGLRELIIELRDRLREEREVSLEVKGLIAELQAFQKHDDTQKVISAIGANPEGGLP